VAAWLNMASATQQFLELYDAPVGVRRFSCRGIFLPNYLVRHFAEQAGYPAAMELCPLYDEARKLWEENVGRSPQSKPQ
jgi:hypothetical protein